MPSIRPYDPGAVVAVVGGLQLENFGPDNAIAIAFNEDQVTQQIGVDGESALSFNRNRSGRFTFTLMQTSPSNAVLQAVNAAFQLTKALVPILVKDGNSGATLAFAEQCWPIRVPDLTYAKEAGTVEWIFETNSLVHAISGNGVL